MADAALNRPLRVFLCHSSNDKPAVRELYKRLTVNGVDVWFDEESLLAGQEWQVEIPKAVRRSDIVIVCLSNQSVTKTGYNQKEIKFALDIAEEQPEGTIFVIPLKLDDCEVPDRLKRWQWVNLFMPNGYEHLMRSLRARADGLGFVTPFLEDASALNVSDGINANAQQVTVSNENDVISHDNLIQPPSLQSSARPFNPYSSGDPVRERRMLFGREREIAMFKDWLNPDRPVHLITLHGQRRVGKTSLALVLEHELHSLPIRCVYVDLQRVSDQPSIERVYREIGLVAQKALFPKPSGVAVAAPIDLPSLADFQSNPSEILFRYLDQLQVYLAPQRLIVMLDEFNLLVDETQPAVFSHLRAVTTAGFEGITLLLMTHTTHYRLSDPHSVRKLYEQGPGLELPMLDREAAGHLIRDPLQGYLRFDDDVVDRIISGTSGLPYLINLLCYDLVQRSNTEAQNHIRLDDLEQSLRALLRNGETYFSFLTESMTRVGKTLIIYIAQIQMEINDWVPLDQCALMAKLRYQQAEDVARRLNSVGALDFRLADNQIVQVRITIEYFARWVRQTWSPEQLGDIHDLA
jgi:hypothetical protein